MRLGIFGVGALGCLYGVRLAPWVDTTLFGHWDAQVKRINEQGISIRELSGRDFTHHLKATTDIRSLAGIDIALVLVKSPQTAETAKEVAAVLRPRGLVITLQNGLGNREILGCYFSQNQILVGTTSQGANLSTTGHLTHAGNGMTYLEKHTRSNDVVALFAQAGIPVQIQADVRQVIWGKLAVNAGINPLTALLGWQNGELNEDSRAREMMCVAAEETAAVAQSLGITLPYQSASRAVIDVAQATATNRSSMLQDLMRGAKSEIQAISGEIVRLGEDSQVETSTNRFLLNTVVAGEEMVCSFWGIDRLYKRWREVCF